MQIVLLHSNRSFELKAYLRDLTPLSDMAVLRRAKFKISIMTRHFQWLLSAGLLTAWSGLPCQSLNFAHNNLLWFLSSFSALNPLNWFWMGDMIVRTPCSNTSRLDTWHLPPLQNGHHPACMSRCDSWTRATMNGGHWFLPHVVQYCCRHGTPSICSQIVPQSQTHDWGGIVRRTQKDKR